VPASSLESVVRHLRRLHAPASDGELLSRFADGRDADAFAELARRHGPMVLGVCRRILGDAHAAEDAFQTTFLTLARYARSLRRPAALAAWLHGVAVRTAQRARARRQRCQHTETHRLPPSQPPDPLAEVSGRELVAAIDEELARLPECYRAPLLLCGLDGLTRDETAARLGWSLGTLRGRLERGRELLRKRLTARGLTVPTVLAGLVTADRATVPAGLLAATVRLALTASPATWGPAAALALAGVLFAAVGVGAIIATEFATRRRRRAARRCPGRPAARRGRRPARLAAAAAGADRQRPGVLAGRPTAGVVVGGLRPGRPTAHLGCGGRPAAAPNGGDSRPDGGPALAGRRPGSRPTPLRSGRLLRLGLRRRKGPTPAGATRRTTELPQGR
jgi:RNA polymerase sigma factor (sigma-70 family)